MTPEKNTQLTLYEFGVKAGGKDGVKISAGLLEGLPINRDFTMGYAKGQIDFWQAIIDDCKQE